MGAYYSYAIIKKDKKTKEKSFFINHEFKKSIYEEVDYCGQKFLESFYHANIDTQILYAILKDMKKIILNTQCDYDKVGTFKTQLEFAEKYNIELNTELEEKIKNLIELDLDLYNYSKKVKKEDILYFKNLETGYIICPETKEYIDLKYFNDLLFVKNIWIVSPLALLTRSSAVAQGGGDFDISYLVDVKSFKKNKNFNIELISKWKDKEIEYKETIEEISKDFKNISKEITLIEY